MKDLTQALSWAENGAWNQDKAANFNQMHFTNYVANRKRWRIEKCKDLEKVKNWKRLRIEKREELEIEQLLFKTDKAFKLLVYQAVK